MTELRQVSSRRSASDVRRTNPHLSRLRGGVHLHSGGARVLRRQVLQRPEALPQLSDGAAHGAGGRWQLCPHARNVPRRLRVLRQGDGSTVRAEAGQARLLPRLLHGAGLGSDALDLAAKRGRLAPLGLSGQLPTPDKAPAPEQCPTRKLGVAGAASPFDFASSSAILDTQRQSPTQSLRGQSLHTHLEECREGGALLAGVQGVSP